MVTVVLVVVTVELVAVLLVAVVVVLVVVTVVAVTVSWHAPQSTGQVLRTKAIMTGKSQNSGFVPKQSDGSCSFSHTGSAIVVVVAVAVTEVAVAVVMVAVVVGITPDIHVSKPAQPGAKRIS